MDALFLWEIRAIVKKSVWKCRILEKTHHLIHLIFESADSNMENIKERKRKRGKEKLSELQQEIESVRFELDQALLRQDKFDNYYQKSTKLDQLIEEYIEETERSK